MGNIREIVNGGQLGAFINKKVSITGFVINQAPNGLSFDLKTTDNQVVKINLKRVVESPLEGYVEVQGTSTGKGVMCDDFVIFSNSKFDAKSYNKVCNYLATIPNLWNTS